MATCLRLEDRLDGAGNFVPWKARLVLILEKNELWDEVVYNTTAVPIVIPPTTDATALTAFNKKDIKARRIILLDFMSLLKAVSAAASVEGGTTMGLAVVL